jgi:hypothetical protein
MVLGQAFKNLSRESGDSRGLLKTAQGIKAGAAVLTSPQGLPIAFDADSLDDRPPFPGIGLCNESKAARNP